MALGPDQILNKVRAAKDAEDREWEESGRKALRNVETIADCAEKLFDKKIPTITPDTYGYLQVDPCEIKKAFGYEHETNLVFNYAQEELRKAIEKRYLPKGWKRVFIFNGKYSCHIGLDWR
jgi:hypothetical protein